MSYSKINEMDNMNEMKSQAIGDNKHIQTPGPKTSTIGDLPFSFHLNLPHPVPQITSSDIKSLT